MFGTRYARLGVLIAAVSLGLTACGGGGGSQTVGAEQTSPADADPNGHLRFAVATPGPPLDPHKAASAIAFTPYLTPVYDRLTQMVDEDGSVALAPMVATEWEYAPDGMSVTFTLRDDVVFSDGVTLDAAAVKASLDRAVAPGSTTASAFRMIESVDVLDPTHVRIETNRPAVDLPYVLSGVEGSLVSPEALDNPDLDTNPVGSGPYVVTEFRGGDSVTYERRDGYWDPDAQMAKTITIRGIPDDNTRLNALRSGQIDMMLTKVGQLDPATLGPGLDSYAYPTPAATLTVLLNVDRPALNNRLVRQALNFAVDREGIAEALAGGQCEAANQQVFAGKEGHLEDLPMPYAYDPERARELLAEAGADGLSMTIMVGAGWSPEEKMANAVASQLKEVGVDVTVLPTDGNEMVTRFATDQEDARLTARQAMQSPAVFFLQNYTTPGLFPGTLPDSFATQLAVAFDPTASDEERGDALDAVAGVVNEEALDIPLCGSRNTVTYSDKVIGASNMGIAHVANAFDLRYVGIAR